MNRPRRPALVATAAFLAIVGLPGLVQLGVEARRGERPYALTLFERAPTPAHLREYEAELADRSWLARLARPWMQCLQLRLLRDGGDRLLAGRDGWLFYQAGRGAAGRTAAAGSAAPPDMDPIPAIVDFRDQLAARGIALLVMPVPDKESIYPDMLTRRARAGRGFVASSTRTLLERLRAAGVDVVDLFQAFDDARARGRAAGASPLYLKTDTHWSPAGVELAAALAARTIRARDWIASGTVEFATRPCPVARLGDLVRMLELPECTWCARPELVPCAQVVAPGTGETYQDDPTSPALLLGDSFLRIYETDEPGAAGFVAHLARALRRPLASLVSDGGASTLVRQELSRRPALLAGKRLVIWQFVERDIRSGLEGWQLVPLGTGAGAG